MHVYVPVPTTKVCSVTNGKIQEVIGKTSWYVVYADSLRQNFPIQNGHRLTPSHWITYFFLLSFSQITIGACERLVTYEIDFVNADVSFNRLHFTMPSKYNSEYLVWDLIYHSDQCYYELISKVICSVFIGKLSFVLTHN